MAIADFRWEQPLASNTEAKAHLCMQLVQKRYPNVRINMMTVPYNKMTDFMFTYGDTRRTWRVANNFLEHMQPQNLTASMEQEIEKLYEAKPLERNVPGKLKELKNSSVVDWANKWTEKQK